jgi:hypothetical protein
MKHIKLAGVLLFKMDEARARAACSRRIVRPVEKQVNLDEN